MLLVSRRKESFSDTLDLVFMTHAHWEPMYSKCALFAPIRLFQSCSFK